MPIEIYDDEPQSAQECFKCGQIDAKLDNVKYWLESVLDHLYGRETLYLDDFEHCLDELARSIDMRLPESDLQLHRITLKPQPQTRSLDKEINWWKLMSQSYLKQTENQ